MNRPELFHQIKESCYFVTNNGEVFKVNKGVKSFLRPCIRNGYLSVRINIDEKIKWHTIHRLVATAFIPNFENKLQVNHLNGIKTDNRVENLEWATQSENTKHAYDNKLLKPAGNRKGYSGKLNPASISVIQLTTDNEFVKEWDSINLTKEDGFVPGHISKCCKKIFKSHKGYKWMYKTEYEN